MNDDIWKIPEAIAISLSFVVAGFAYIADRNRERKKEAQERLLSWQTGVVHEIFQKAGTQIISFDDIIQRYRGEAQAADVDRKALSSEALRKILFRFVSSNIATQHGSDRYSLKSLEEARDTMSTTMTSAFDFAKMKDVFTAPNEKEDLLKLLKEGTSISSVMRDLGPMMAMSLTHTNNEQRIFGIVAGMLIEEPNKYTSNDLVVKLAGQLQIPNEQVSIALNTMIGKTRVHVRQDGKLSLAKSIIDINGDEDF